jgi:hypothetical protein
VHYQTLEIEFPIFSRPGKTIYEDEEVKLERLYHSVLDFRFLPQTSWKRNSLRNVGQTIISQPGSLNPIFHKQAIYIVPRTKSVPRNTDGFKFTAAEVCGSIFAREKKLFDALDGNLILEALKDVCLPADSSAAKKYKDDLVTSIKNLRR